MPVEQTEETAQEETTQEETAQEETSQEESAQKEESQEESTQEEETTEESEEEPTDETDDTPDVEELLKDIEDKDKQVSKLKDQYTKENKKLNYHKNKAEKLEGVVSNLVNEKLESVPEEFKELVPSGDSAEKLAWLNKAESNGLFKKQEQANPDVEIGKPLELGKRNEKAQEKGLTAQQKLANYFSSLYSK